MRRPELKKVPDMQRSAKDIVVFTGAGISASAGLRTYRGPNGLWSDNEIVKASQASGLKSHPRFCWDHWGGLRKQVDASVPTAAHRALASAQARLPKGYSLNIVTQNVDGLHGRALAAERFENFESYAPGDGSIIEFHGNVFQTRCTNEKCALQPFEDHDSHTETLPHCPLCGSLLRPGIVLFGEQIDSDKSNKVETAKRLFRTAGIVIVVGTTLQVEPARQVVDIKKRFYSGVETIWINVEPGPYVKHFRKRYQASADEVLPELLAKLVPAC